MGRVACVATTPLPTDTFIIEDVSRVECATPTPNCAGFFQRTVDFLSGLFATRAAVVKVLGKAIRSEHNAALRSHRLGRRWTTRSEVLKILEGGDTYERIPCAST